MAKIYQLSPDRSCARYVNTDRADTRVSLTKGDKMTTVYQLSPDMSGAYYTPLPR